MQESFRKTCIIILLLGTNKQYIFKPARSSRKCVSSSYLSFSVHLVHDYFGATHARPSAVQVGSVGLRMPSVVTPSHPPWRLSTPARSCLFISAWLRMLMLIDFIKRQKLEGSNLTSLHISGISPAEHTGVTTRQVWLLL